MQKYRSFLLLGIIAVVFSLVTFHSAYASSPSFVNAKITGPNTVLLTFTEQVNTTAADYSNFIGSLSGRSIVSVNGSGTTAVTLVFSGTPFAANAAGSFTIGSTLVGTYDNAPLASIVTVGAGVSVNITDAQAPALSSIQISSNSPTVSLGTAGNSGTLVFTTDEPIVNPAVIINGASVPVSGSGSGPFSAAYTISQSTGSSVSFSVTLTDTIGNTTQLSLTTSYSNLQNPLDVPALNLVETAPIGSVTTQTPAYRFSSTAIGKINYFGECTSPTTSAVVGINNIIFNPLLNGTHNSCYIAVTDANGNASNLLPITPFAVSVVGAPSVTPVSTPVSRVPATTTTTPATTAYVFTTPLSIGASGAAVTALQQKLAAAGVFTGSSTGYFGSATQVAVKKYQTLHHIAPLGSVGPATRALLNK